MKEQLENLQIGEVFENVDVKNFTTFKLSAKANFLVLPDNLNHLIRLLKFLNEKKINYKVIGKGSNLVFVHDYNGVLIRLDKFDHLEINETKVIVGAGYYLPKLSLQMANLGLSGLEFANGIPGNIGGSVVNNAGAYQKDMASIITSVKVLTPNGKIKIYSNKELNFCYRSSFLQFKKDYICLEAELKLEKSNKEEIIETIQKRREKRIKTQPLEYPSAGSVFRNPENESAWKLINALGFKEKRIGGAEVSKKHANFIINVGNATGKDVQKLIFEIKEKIKETYNIDLICEQEFVE